MEGVNWIGLVWLSTGTSGGAVVKTVMNMWVPESAVGFLEGLREEQLIKKDWQRAASSAIPARD